MQKTSKRRHLYLLVISVIPFEGLCREYLPDYKREMSGGEVSGRVQELPEKNEYKSVLWGLQQQ
jgi:hypothetical protein